MNILTWIFSGIVAGWLAGVLVKGRGFGLVGDLLIGLLGGVVGGWLDCSDCKHSVGWEKSSLPHWAACYWSSLCV